MHNLSLFGTASDVGKSTLTFVIAKLLQQRGINTVPFKAQNVSNNSHIADDGAEIGISTYFQASILGVETSWHLNPILLKSGGKNHASLIIAGKEQGEKEVLEYYRELDSLKPLVKEAFLHLNKRYDCVVAEGAGGCVELNLLDKDLSNTFIAQQFNTKIILIADIEKGGVFASIYGSVKLMPKHFQENLIGVIINKFRGDKSLFDTGVKIIEKEFGVPVLGVLPYIPLNLGFEDSQSLINYQQTKPHAKIKIGVIQLPHISNFTDFEPLILDEEISLSFITNNLDNYDVICIPGSKRVVEDLIWLKECGLFTTLQSFNKPIIGICGGYEMLFSKILDPDLIESEIESIQGIGHIEGNVIFHQEKIAKKSHFIYHDNFIQGYEIHYAQAEGYESYYEDGHIFGTFLHGIFDNDSFRNHYFKKINKDYKGFVFAARKAKKIEKFIDTMQISLDMDRIEQCLHL